MKYTSQLWSKLTKKEKEAYEKKAREEKQLNSEYVED